MNRATLADGAPAALSVPVRGALVQALQPCPDIPAVVVAQALAGLRRPFVICSPGCGVRRPTEQRPAADPGTYPARRRGTRVAAQAAATRRGTTVAGGRAGCWRAACRWLRLLGRSGGRCGSVAGSGGGERRGRIAVGRHTWCLFGDFLVGVALRA